MLVIVTKTQREPKGKNLRFKKHFNIYGDFVVFVRHLIRAKNCLNAAFLPLRTEHDNRCIRANFCACEI